MIQVLIISRWRYTPPEATVRAPLPPSTRAPHTGLSLNWFFGKYKPGAGLFRAIIGVNAARTLSVGQSGQWSSKFWMISHFRDKYGTENWMMLGYG